VLPRSREDVIAAVELASKYGVPVLPRGGGTSLAGQTVGRAIILDMSKYMNRVLEVNTEEQWARVQPGIVLEQLNHEIRHGAVLHAGPGHVQPLQRGRRNWEQLLRLPLGRLRQDH
jgi:FAD/FMN-containing dehydrogenase